MNDIRHICNIVLTTWSPSKYRMDLLANSIKSLRENTVYPHNLFVMDNGPEEQTKFLGTQKHITHILMNGNEGIAKARNRGVLTGDGQYIAFVDNDIEYESGWLTNCINAIEKYPDRKLIAVPLRSVCQSDKFQDGTIDEYKLFRIASGCCQVMRRSSFEEIGEWANVPRVGGNYSKRASRMGYRYMWHTDWNVKHVGAIRSWHYRDKLIDGKWVQEKELQSAYWDYLWTKKYGQNIRKHQILYNHIKPLIKGNVLDLGCGVTSLHDDNAWDITGLDLSPVAIKTMQKRCPHGKWIVHDIINSGLPSNSYETVLLISVIEHFSEYEQVVREAQRLSKGQVIIVVPVEHYDKDHRHPVWDRAMIESTVESIIGKCDVNIVSNRWWIIKSGKESN